MFLSWAHADEGVKNDLLDRLAPELQCLRDISTVWWQDSHIATGEPWRRAILQHLGECDYGVQLLSPAFLTRSFIVAEEIPPFVGPAPAKQALPVGLKPIQLDGSVETHGIDAMQIFRLDHTHFYSELREARRRDKFAAQLAGEIRRRILGENGWRAL
jgi:hypothetical protein